MARKPRPLDAVDDDLAQTLPEGMTNAEQGPAPTVEGTQQTDVGQIFQVASEEALTGDWRTRKDQWDHRQFNPEFHLGEDRQNADGTYRARRAPPDGQGRQAYSQKVTAGKARPLPISTVELFLISSHAMMAGAFDLPELKLDKDDANNLAIPIVKVAALYDLKVDPRLEAYGMLIIAIAGVYGPKVGAIYERFRQENARNVTPSGQRAGARPPDLRTAPVFQPAPVAKPAAEEAPKGGGPPTLSPDDVTKLFGGEV